MLQIRYVGRKFGGEDMFTITINSLDHKLDKIVRSTPVETLNEAEIFAIGAIIDLFGFSTIELVYIEDLDYYVYDEESRIARLTILSIYEKVRTKE